MDIDRLARTHITTGDLQPPHELIQSLNSGQTPLSHIVKALGEYLVSTVDETRLKALTFLANNVKLIDPLRINRPATATLTSFFSAKLDDFESLPVALEALTVLSKLKTFSDDAAVDLYRALVEQVNLKSYVQATRHMAYVLVDTLLALHRKAFIALGAEFLNSYTKLVDGEKDPRNLMLLFSIDRVILLEFDIENHIEDLFDVTFCYFPIMFRPPPNDPYGITAEDLKAALRGCMSASPLFAKQAIPLFLEKFSTAAGPAMKDLLQSMSVCLPVYGATTVQDRGAELWEGIKTEIMYSSDISVELLALDALESLIKTLYPKVETSPAGLAHDIIKQCLEMLKDPEKNQAVSATKILGALLRASASVGPFAYAQALPQLFRQFNNPPSTSQRPPLLAAVSALVVAARSTYTDQTRSLNSENTLEPFRESLVDVLREGLRSDDLRIAAINGSVATLQLGDLAGRQETEDIVKAINDIVINDRNPVHRHAAIRGLSEISAIAPETIESATLPLLFHNLPEHAPKVSDIGARDDYRGILESLTTLCAQPALFETLVVRVITKLEMLAESYDGEVDQSQAEGWSECHVAYAWDLLHCLDSVIKAKVQGKHMDLAKQYDRIVPRLYNLVVSASKGGKHVLFRQDKLIAVVGDILETLLWEVSVEKQSHQLEATAAAFENGDFAGILQAPSIGHGLSSPLRDGASTAEKNLMRLYSSTLQGIRPSCADPCPSAANFIVVKARWVINEASNDVQLLSALDLITAYVNKRDEQLDALPGILETLWVQDVIDTEQSKELRRKALLVYLHIVRGLTLLRHPLAYPAIDRVVEVLSLSTSDPDFIEQAAQGFNVIAEKPKASHLNLKLLYAQKMWHHLLPQLIDGDRDASGRGRLPYLIAFSSLLPLVPASLCISSLATTLPLLLRSLSLPGPAQRTRVLTTLILVLETQNLSTEVDSLLHRSAQEMVDGISKSYLLDPDMASNSRSRSTSLRALTLIPDAIRFDSLRTVKSRVWKELETALDDPARSVRREAVECRARWYRYGS